MEERKQIKKHIEEELEGLHFTKQENVLNQLKNHPTWKTRFKQLWNKEITIPLLPVSSAFVLLIFGYGFFNMYELNNQFEQKEFIEIGGNTYWKDEIEGMIDNEDED